MSQPAASRRLMVCDIGFTCDIDGPGQRMIIYLKGCNLCCPWCALPETISPQPELLFYANRVSQPEIAIHACPHAAIVMRDGQLIRTRHICDACSGRECLQSKLSAFEWVGNETSVNELVAMAERYRPFFGQQGGITIGGGEPTCQYGSVRRLLSLLKQKHFSTVMETNGTHHRLPELFPDIDLVLIDLKHPDNGVCKAVTRQGNTTVLKNIHTRFQQKRPLRVRIPLVPGFNDDPATLNAFGRVLSGIGRLAVEIIPFHRRGEVKWNALGKVMPFVSRETPAPEAARLAAEHLVRYGLAASTLY